MAKDFFFHLKYKEWLVSTADWSASARGWYINLLCHQADKGCLPNDIERLAQLAGVKFSEFEDFKGCFKHTLSEKFKRNDKGRLENENLKKQLDSRNEYKEKQSKRGKIGAFIKKMRAEHNLKKSQWAEISKELSKIDFENKTEKEISIRLKHTLKAFIENENENEINNDNDNDKIKAEKIKFAEDVTMTNVEHSALIERFGEKRTSAMIEKLNNYKLSKGKKYKSDYRAILSWVQDEVKENESKKIHVNV